MLDIQRPLVIYDTETTGTNRERDRIVQIGAIKLLPGGGAIEKNTLVNPTIPIPPETTEVHHITDAMVADSPTFAQLAKSFAAFIHMVDWCGYNVWFDVSITVNEFKRARVNATMDGRLVDANKIMHHYHRRNLAAAVEEYLGEAARKEFETQAHDAFVDASWTARVTVAQLKQHGELTRTVEALHVRFFETPEPGYIDPEKKFAWRYGQPVINFGNKYPQRPFQEVDAGFWRWIIDNDFSGFVKKIAADALRGVYPAKP